MSACVDKSRQKQKEVDVREGDELRDNFNCLNTEMWLISDTKKGFNVSFWLQKSCQISFLVQGPRLLLVWLGVSGLSFVKISVRTSDLLKSPLAPQSSLN